MQIEPPADLTPLSLPIAQPLAQANQNELMVPSPTTRESGRLLQKGTNSPFVKHVSHASFLQMHLSLCDHLSSMPNLRYGLEGLGAADRGQTSVDELLRYVAGFGHRTLEGMTSS